MEKLLSILICLLLASNLLAQPSNGKLRQPSKATIEANIQANIRQLENHPNNLNLYLQIAESYLELKEFEKATDWYDKAVRVSPNNAEVLYWKGIAQYRTGEIQWAEAASDFMKATKKDKSFHQPYVYLGRIYRQIGKLELAEHFLNQGLKLKSNDSELLTERAELFRAANQPEQALDDLILAISQNGQFAPAYAALANFYFDRKDYNKAVDYANQALSIEENHLPALRTRAHSFIRKNQATQACSDIEQLRLAGENLDDFKVQCY